MNISDFLHYLYTKEIEISVENDEINIDMEKEYSIPDMKEQKRELKLRLLNNQFAQEQGWLIYQFGELYSYQYSRNGFIFIERHTDETVEVYRCAFDKDNHATRIKAFHERISFSEAYQKAKGFLDWLHHLQFKNQLK